MLALPCVALAQTTSGIPPAITTPDKVESRLGVLEFKDGTASAEIVTKVYDNLDFTHAFETFRQPRAGSRRVARQRSAGT
jgi:hypothetical protein